MTNTRITRYAILFALGFFGALGTLRADFAPQDENSAPAVHKETPEEWLARQEKKYGKQSSEAASPAQTDGAEETDVSEAPEEPESDADEVETPVDEPLDESRDDAQSAGATSEEGAEPADPQAARRWLPADQERDIVNRRDEIRRRFTADELRRARRKVEEDRYYRELQERQLREARSAHVSTANFGHVYHHNNITRGGMERKERIAYDMSVGEYYGGMWKHVSVDTALIAPTRVDPRFRRTHNAEYFYEAVLERSISNGLDSRYRKYMQNAEQRRTYW